MPPCAVHKLLGEGGLKRNIRKQLELCSNKRMQIRKQKQKELRMCLISTNRKRYFTHDIYLLMQISFFSVFFPSNLFCVSSATHPLTVWNIQRCSLSPFTSSFLRETSNNDHKYCRPIPQAQKKYIVYLPCHRLQQSLCFQYFLAL